MVGARGQPVHKSSVCRTYIAKIMDHPIPKKSLGQHWLHDEKSLQAMVVLADIHSDDTVVEVGPGLGTLTSYLAKTDAHIKAVEYDTQLYRELVTQKKALFGDRQNTVELINQDILDFRFDQIKGSYKVVANIPYYLTSNLIRVLSETPNPPELVVLLIQKEVAERLCAGPGDMSLLSVWTQMYFECSLGLVVPAKLFTPPPKVDSQIAIMRRREVPVYGQTDKIALNQVVKAGFSNKRKTLHNSLAAGLNLSKDVSAALLQTAAISPTSRPQELSLEQWVNLADSYTNIKNT